MWVLVLLAGCIALILYMPLGFRLRFAGPRPQGWSAELAWGGLVGLGWDADGRYLFAGGFRRRLTRAQAGGHGRGGRLFSTEGAEERRAFGRLAAAAWEASTFTAVGKVRYGFADPALTAWLHALLCAAMPGADFSAEPDFSRECWEGELTLIGRLRPVRIIRPLAAVWLVFRQGKKGKGGDQTWQAQT